jgi:membrane protease YdiL (CAAX protease family)
MHSSPAHQQNHSLMCIAAVLIYFCAFFFPPLLPGYERLYQSGFAMLFVSLAFNLPCTLLLWRQYNRNYPFLPLGSFRWRYFFIGLIAIAVLNFIWQFIGVREEWMASLSNYPPLVVLGLIFAIAVSAPFCEEIIFRGFLLNAFIHWGRFARQLGIVVTSIFFAVLHEQYHSPSTFVWLFTFSALLCVVRMASGSLLVPMILHMVNNALALYVTFSQ